MTYGVRAFLDLGSDTKPDFARPEGIDRARRAIDDGAGGLKSG